MAITYTKSKPDYYNVGYTSWVEYNFQSVSCPTSNSGLAFRYQLGTFNIPVTFKFNITPKNPSSTGENLFYISIDNKYTKFVQVARNYRGEISVTFNSNEVTTRTVNVYVYRASGYSIDTDIVATTCTYEAFIQSLGLQKSSDDVYISTTTLRGEATLTFVNRFDCDIYLTIEGRTGTTKVTSDSTKITFSISDIPNTFNVDEKVINIQIKDSIGRDLATSVKLKRYPVTFTQKYDPMSPGQTQVYTLQDPYNLNIRAQSFIAGSSLNDETFLSSGKYEITITEYTAFVEKAHTSANTVTVITNFQDAYRKYQKLFSIVRPALTVVFTGSTDSSTDPPTKYTTTGAQFQLQFGNRQSRELTIKFKNLGNVPLRNSLGGTDYIASNDIETFDCLKRWFDDNGNATTQKFSAQAIVTDLMLRAANVEFEIRAGDDIKPIINTVVDEPLQPETTPRGTDWPSTLANYYVQGYTKAKFEVTASAPTNAGIKSVYLKSSKLGTVQLTKNTTTGKYEKTTTSALTADTPYTIEVTDQRGLTTTTQEQTIIVLPYRIPNCEQVNYYRVNSSGQKTDDGARCYLQASYFYSPLYEPDTGEALNEKYATCVFGGTDVYRDYVPGFWRPTGTIIRRTVAADIEHSYVIDFYAYDLLNSVHLTYILSTAGVIMDFLAGGKGIGLGKVAETSKMVEVNPEWKLQAKQINVYVNGQYTDLSTILQQLLGS